MYKSLIQQPKKSRTSHLTGQGFSGGAFYCVGDTIDWKPNVPRDRTPHRIIQEHIKLWANEKVIICQNALWETK